MPHTLSILREVRLPVMPYTAQRVRALVDDLRSTNGQIEEVLLCDPAATLALYRAAERLRRGTVDELTGPAHALSLIGRTAFRQAFEQLPLITAEPVHYLLSPAFAYSQAAHAGWYAEQIGRCMGFRHPVEMRVAALLQHPAVLALWASDFEAAARASNAMRDGVGFSTAFTAELRHPLREIDRQLAVEWDLPRLAREVAGDWDAANRLPQSVSLATRLALVGAAGWPSEETHLNVTILAGLLPHHQLDAQTWWHRQTAAAARILAPFGYPLPARELLLLPGGEAEVEVPSLPRRPARATAKAATAARPNANLSQRLRLALQDLQKATGTRRVLLALPDRERHQLRARLTVGCARENPLCQLAVPIRQKHLFSLLLAARRALWVRRDNRDKYEPYLAPLPLDSAAERGFFAMSLFSRDRPLGILYADGGRLSADGFGQFQERGRSLEELIAGRGRHAA